MNDLVTVEMINEDCEYVPTQVKRGTVIIDEEGDVMRLGGDDMWYKMNRDGTFSGLAHDLDSITVYLVIDGNAYYPVPSLPAVEVPDDWTWAKVHVNYYGNQTTFMEQVRKNPANGCTERRRATNSPSDLFDPNTKIVELFPDIEIEGD